MCSASPEPSVNEPVRALNIEFFSARLEPRVREPEAVLKREFLAPRLDIVVVEEVGLRAQLVAVPA